MGSNNESHDELDNKKKLDLMKMSRWKCCRQLVRSDPDSNIIAGGFGGITSLIVGYPFDTIKVRIQTDDRNIYRGTLDCFKQMLFKEGPLSFFRGMSGLFVFATPRLALIFHGNSMGLNFIRGSDKEDAKISNACGNPIGCLDSDENSSSQQATLKEIFMAGILSQIAAVPLVTQPCERIKVLLQTEPPESTKGQIQCLREVIKRDGIRNGLFRGTLLTYARDIPSFSTYFLTYEVVRTFLKSQTNSKEAKTTSKLRILGDDIWITLVAGSCAGLSGWAIAIPFDVVKSRHQVTFSGSVYSTVTQLWRQEKLYGFYRGAIPILIRAVPANAAAFLGYETAVSVITHIKYKNFINTQPIS